MSLLSISIYFQWNNIIGHTETYDSIRMRMRMRMEYVAQLFLTLAKELSSPSIYYYLFVYLLNSFGLRLCHRSRIPSEQKQCYTTHFISIDLCLWVGAMDIVRMYRQTHCHHHHHRNRWWVGHHTCITCYSPHFVHPIAISIQAIDLFMCEEKRERKEKWNRY